MKKFFSSAFFLLLLAALSTSTSCKKSSGTNNEITKPVVKDPVVNKDAVADLSISSYNSTFLLSSGTTQYYKTAINNTEKDYFWCQALEIQMMQDVYLRTKTSAHKTLITNLLNTFLEQNKGNASLYDWAWNEFNDDILWAGIAFARGNQITGDTKFLDQAKYAFDRAYDRGWDNELGGGIWWDIRKEDKSGLSNNTAVILACYIYEATGDKTYLNKATAIYDWIKLKLYNHETGAVSETIKANGVLATDANVYNVGAFVSAANHLHKITKQISYFNDAKRSVDYVKNNKTVNGIMTHGTRNGTWQSEFSRGLGEFVRDNNLWSTYYPWMKQNAEAAWATRRADLNIGWNQWVTQTPKDNSFALECVGTVVMQQVTPATQPGL
jgi:predicted alpha-1,6-mannanase (GH76 family)